MIERIYLQWVGTSSFATVDDYLADVKRHGVCKRLPNLNIALEVAKPGTLVFLVHDQGRACSCLACSELIVCPKCGGTGVFLEERKSCPRCHGLGSIERSTGGSALVDGEQWPYIRLLRLRKNRASEFWKREHQIEQVQFCKVCGGRGKLPQGVVFGFFAPQSVVWIRGGRQPKSALTRLQGARIAVFRKSRHFGRNLERGGYYAVVPPDRKCTPPVHLVNAVREMFGPGVQYAHGFFGQLNEPIPYTGKFFRGVKRWEAPPYVPEDFEPNVLEGVA